MISCQLKGSLNRSVVISTRYRLASPVFESLLDNIFRKHTDRLWVPNIILYNGCKRPCFSFDPQNTSRSEVKETLELNLYKSFGTSRPFLRWYLHFFFQLPVRKFIFTVPDIQIANNPPHVTTISNSHSSSQKLRTFYCTGSTKRAFKNNRLV
jgi:hypothetical protein